jgi:hypothetical protein
MKEGLRETKKKNITYSICLIINNDLIIYKKGNITYFAYIWYSIDNLIRQ